jgi:V/A-type H+/Na+-transporting ATPase subunit K
MEIALVYAILGAVMVMVFAGIGSAVGVAFSAQAAAGVMTEDPEKFGIMIPLVGLPGTQGFYGFLIGFLVLNKLSLLSASIKMPSIPQGLQILSICGVVGMVEAVSAIYQGMVSAACIGIVAKRPEEAGKALVLPIFVEIYAILGLAAAFLLLNGVKI